MTTFDTSKKAHLGVGWAFPVKPVHGALTFARYEDDVEQAIQIILLTAPKERVMLPDFGAGLRDFVFEPNSQSTRTSIAARVLAALVNWEPRITIENVSVTEGEEAANELLIHIDYVVRSTNVAYNRVYPFYLLESKA
jgi:phage baseplate assembly protein W